MNQFIKPIAKAVTAAVVPFAVAAIVAALKWLGIDDVPVDPSLVETVVAAAVSALLVWLIPNQTPEPEEN